ncbi:MAG: hypothetical protein AAFS10_12550, partial [Myxococcota bacterium]
MKTPEPPPSTRRLLGLLATLLLCITACADTTGDDTSSASDGNTSNSDDTGTTNAGDTTTDAGDVTDTGGVLDTDGVMNIDDTQGIEDSLTALDTAEDEEIDGAIAEDAPDSQAPPDTGPAPPYTVAFVDTAVTYRTDYPQGQNSNREVLVRVWYPVGVEVDTPIVLVSHGGSGSINGHTRFQHLAHEFAGQGYISVHLNHARSTGTVAHRWDRPNDVSAVLDAVLDDTQPILPTDFIGTLDRDHVGHVGHSWGAYTAHAVAGADMENPLTAQPLRWNFRDARVDAIVALSPQGWGGFGAFDEAQALDQPSEDNSWRVVMIPAYTLIGELEMDGVAGVEDLDRCPECFRAQGWRRFPFERYPADGRR